jgi:hypothetical protein
MKEQRLSYELRIPVLNAEQLRVMLESTPDDFADEPAELSKVAEVLNVSTADVRRWIASRFITAAGGLSTDCTTINLRKFVASFPKQVHFECPISRSARELVVLYLDEIPEWCRANLIWKYWIGDREFHEACGCGCEDTAAAG